MEDFLSLPIPSLSEWFYRTLVSATAAGGFRCVPPPGTPLPLKGSAFPSTSAPFWGGSAFLARSPKTPCCYKYSHCCLL